MIAFYTSLNRIEVYHLRNLMEAEGIPCFVRNEALSQLAGEIPFIECSLQLWLRRGDDELRAKKVLWDFHHGPAHTEPWYCPCGEWLEGQFTVCWRCGMIRKTGD